MPETQRFEPAVIKQHIIKLHKDMRKRFQQGFFQDSTFKDLGLSKSKDKVELPYCEFRYYVTSEYGSRGINPHYHGLYWNLPDNLDLVLCLFKALWPWGFVTVYPGTDEATAAYTAKYLVNDSLVHSYGPRPFALMSKGLGRSYLDNEKLLDWHRSDPVHRCYIPIENKRSIMPRYLRDRIFDDDMKAAIACDSERRNSVSGKILDPHREIMENERKRHLQQEAVKQALWRFEKNNKIK